MPVAGDLISSLPHIPPPDRWRRNGDMCVWCGPAGDTARGGAPSGCGERLFRAIAHILPCIPKPAVNAVIWCTRCTRCTSRCRRPWPVTERGRPFSPGEGDLSYRHHSSYTRVSRRRRSGRLPPLRQQTGTPSRRRPWPGYSKTGSVRDPGQLFYLLLSGSYIVSYTVTYI